MVNLNAIRLVEYGCSQVVAGVRGQFKSHYADNSIANVNADYEYEEIASIEEID